jgi:hypothetical protein
VRVVAASVLVCCAVNPAISSTIDYTVTFNAPEFLPGGGPVTPVTGEFQLSFDLAADAAGPVTTNSLNLNVGPLEFQYTVGNDQLVVGGPNFGVNGVMNGTDDALLSILHFSNGGQFGYFAYSLVGYPLYITQLGTVHVSPPPATAVTPIPAALPLFVSALSGLAIAGWRRRTTKAAA